MQCPIDGTQLVMTDRQGVEIDYCPQCCGVWLDRGELDKIIERNAASPAPPPPPRESYTREERPGRKKKSNIGGFLDDLFDF